MENVCTRTGVQLVYPAQISLVLWEEFVTLLSDIPPQKNTSTQKTHKL